MVHFIAHMCSPGLTSGFTTEVGSATHFIERYVGLSMNVQKYRWCIMFIMDRRRDFLYLPGGGCCACGVGPDVMGLKRSAPAFNEVL